jgi:hypothetical protein
LPANACGICIAPASNIAAAMVALMVSSSSITVLHVNSADLVNAVVSRKTRPKLNSGGLSLGVKHSALFKGAAHKCYHRILQRTI